MNGTHIDQPPAPVRGAERPQTMIGIHFAAPLAPRLDLAILIHSPMAFLAVCMGLRFALILEHLAVQSIEKDSELGAEGAFSEGLVMFPTQRRNEAVHLVQEYFRSALPLLEAQFPEFVEIAYFHADEISWYTVQPQESPQPFARWLIPELCEERQRMSNEADQDMLRFVFTAARGLQPPPDITP